MVGNFIKSAQEKLEVTVNRNEFVKIYPIKSKEEARSSRIILNSREKKAKLFSAKKKLFQHRVRRVFINEDFTSNFKLLMTARKLKYEKIFVKTFTSTRLAARGGRVFSYLAPIMWNKLSNHLRKDVTVDSFRRKLKTYFFAQSFYCYL